MGAEVSAEGHEAAEILATLKDIPAVRNPLAIFLRVAVFLYRKPAYRCESNQRHKEHDIRFIFHAHAHRLTFFSRVGFPSGDRQQFGKRRTGSVLTPMVARVGKLLQRSINP